MEETNPYDIGARLNARGYLDWDSTRFAPVCPEPGRPLRCPKDQTKLEREEITVSADRGCRLNQIEILTCDCGHQFQLTNVRGQWKLKDID
jgi:hypothetical protein